MSRLVASVWDGDNGGCRLVSVLVLVCCWLGMGSGGHKGIVPEQGQDEKDACEPIGMSPRDRQRRRLCRLRLKTSSYLTKAP
jgi:hypothetical protein